MGDAYVFGAIAISLITLFLRRAYVKWRVERWCMQPYDDAMRTTGVPYDYSIREWKRRYVVFNDTHSAPLWHWTPAVSREALGKSARTKEPTP